MRITRSVVFHISTISHRALVLASSSLLIIATLTTTALFLQRPETSYAATPPDSCFDFDAGDGTILTYYIYEDNVWGNPICPRDVDIPSTIGGVTVTGIGDWAFYASDLTSVAIPNTVIEIGEYAFDSNDLTSVIIPNSVTSIGRSAFEDNQLTTVVIGN